MPLTPAEVSTVTFTRPRIGESSYHEGEVDEFLDLVHAELLRLTQENNDLRDQLEQRRVIPLNTGRDPGAPQPPGLVVTPPRSPIKDQTAPGVDHHVQAAKILVLAQHEADRLTAETRAEADRMLNQAQTTSARLLAEAKGKTQDVITEARTQAEALLQHARTTAETRQRQSQDKVASLQQDATRTHAEIMDQLHHDKTLLENSFHGLLAFEQQYRIQITTYVQSQLHQLDEAASTAPTGELRPGYAR
jgi:DivIVA domain-containing protein